jgi:hypothetical protein
MELLNSWREGLEVLKALSIVDKSQNLLKMQLALKMLFLDSQCRDIKIVGPGVALTVIIMGICMVSLVI